MYKRHKLLYVIHINRIREMVSFELGKEIEKYVFSSHHKCRTKEEFQVSMRNRSSDFQSPHSDALPLSHRDSIVSRAYYYVHMTLLLYTAKIMVDHTMVRLLPVRLLQPKVRLLHSKVRLLHQISYVTPNISYFAPCRKLR